ncbi:MAG: GNAT family N-acetyltransferase [Anaerolineae bacterium]|nr:GNAT family N-acetyltransferase [Anaerolineae bacterium]
MQGPAYRIHTERLVIRCWQPQDAPLLKAAIDASLDHLRPWMPWTKGEPEAIEGKIARLRQFRANFDLDRDYVYGILNADESEVIGGTGLHTRAGEGALEIGYWIHAAHIGRGLATETAAALTRVAMEVNEVDRVEIHCDPANVRSAAIPRKLDYVCEATLRHRTRSTDGAPRDTMIWTLLRDEYPASTSAKAQIEAFDAIGQKLL